MAQKSNTGIIVGVVSVLVIGTTIFLIVKSARKKAQNQQLPPLQPQQPQGQQEPINQQTQNQTQPTNKLGGFIDTISELFKKKDIETKSDKFTDFKFPIRRGQKGENVRKLQQLILNVKSKALPKYGADGDFGSETANALLQLIGKESIDNQADLDRLKKVGYDIKSKILINLSSPFQIFK